MSDKLIKKELYPSNSQKQSKKEPKVPEKQISKVVVGPVNKKKKTIGDKFKETFVADEAQSVGRYLFMDVVVPTIKETIIDLVTKGINMIFYGDTRSLKRSGSSRSGNPSRINYGNYYNYGSSIEPERRRTIDQRARAAHDFDTLVFNSRVEAENVRDSLVDLTITYGQATVADFYDLAGLTSNYTDHKYGWEELGSSKVRRVSSGYIIVLPRAILLGD